MYQQKFINRKTELNFLEEKYNSNSSEFIVIYGRRRIGKTELMLKFLENKKGFYFLASKEGDRENIKSFSLTLAKFINDENFGKITFADWHSLFDALFKHKDFNSILKTDKCIIIIDEFPFLIHSNKAIPSVFQKIWELILKNKNIMLILSGSAISVMETEVLGYNSPLYGRRTGQWHLRYLDFIFLKQFLPYKTEELAMTWFIIGGVPEYILKFNPKLPFWENMLKNIIRKGSYLYSEVEVLMNEEFREPKNYKLIFKAIVFGYNTLGEICNYTGFDKSMVSKYLEVLSELHILKGESPVTASSKFKKRLYYITDPYFNFWFRFIYPNKIDLEANRENEVLELIKKDFSEYCGYMFECLVDEFLRKKYIFDKFSFTKIGHEWGTFKEFGKTKPYEIDLCALNEQTKNILFCECKWRENMDAKKIFEQLKEKVKYVDWNNNDRKEHFAIFAKSFKKKIKEPNLMLFDLKDIEKVL